MCHRSVTFIFAASFLVSVRAQSQTPTAPVPEAGEVPSVPSIPESTDQAPRDPTLQAGSPDTEETEEIIVTTERRSQKLQDVAAVVKAVQRDELRSPLRRAAGGQPGGSSHDPTFGCRSAGRYPQLPLDRRRRNVAPPAGGAKPRDARCPGLHASVGSGRRSRRGRSNRSRDGMRWTGLRRIRRNDR